MNKKWNRKLIVALLCTTIIGTGITIVNKNIARCSAIESEHTLQKNTTTAFEKAYRDKREQEDKTFEKLALETSKKLHTVLQEKYKKEEKIKQLRQETGLNVVDFEEKQIIISHYGDTYEQNGGYPNITCTGAKLSDGMVASNVYPLGTKFYWEGKVRTVADKGGSHFNRYDRLDVFVPRYSGESDSAYIKRIYKYGKRTVTTTVLKTAEGN